MLDDRDCGLYLSGFWSGRLLCCQSLVKVSIDLLEPLQVFLSWLWSDIALRMRVLDGGERTLRNRGSVWCLQKLWDISDSIDHNGSLWQLFDRFRALVKDTGRNAKGFSEKVEGVFGFLGFVACENESAINFSKIWLTWSKRLFASCTGYGTAAEVVVARQN